MKILQQCTLLSHTTRSISESMLRIHAQPLREFIQATFVASGATDADAKVVADHLVLANLKGHDSHGVGMAPSYVHAIANKRLHVSNHMKIVHDQGAVIHVDGQRGLGQVIGKEAIDFACQRANETGLVCLGLKNSYHIGRIGSYGEQCASYGLVSIHFVNAVGHQPQVAPWGGREAKLQTNPFCCAVPRDDQEPLVLDMATSMIAAGKIRVAYNSGEKVRAGALIDHEGRPTDDPAVLFTRPNGSLGPFGTYKGYGLAVMCELLAGALVGSWTTNPGHKPAGMSVNNMLSFILDPSVFGGVEMFQKEIEAEIAYLKDTKPAVGFESVLVPGDPERITEEERNRVGIPIDETTWNQLISSAKSVGLDDSSIPSL